MQLRTLAFITALGAGMSVMTTASAQAPNWHGFYLDGALGGRSTDTSTTFTVSGVAGSENQDFGKTNWMAEFTGGWRFAPGGAQVVVGIGGFVDVAGTNAGESSFSDPTAVPPDSGSFKLKQENRYGLSVDVGPNWRTMPYLKLTYAWSRFKGELASSGCNSVSGGQTVSGWGFGGGVRHLQSNNLYFFAEVLYQDYGSERFTQTLTCGGVPQVPVNLDFSANNLIGLVGVGWKF